MSGLAVFGLKFPSLLQYDQNRKYSRSQSTKPLSHKYILLLIPISENVLMNWTHLFIRPAFKKIFAQLQRGKCLERFEFLGWSIILLSLGWNG